jgi:ribosomal protein S6--L-glutamate ligase
MQKVFVKIAVLSRQPPVYANQRLIEAGARRSCDVRIVDPLSLPLIFADALPGARQQPDIGFDAVIPRFSPSWQRQGHALLAHWQARGVISLNSAGAISAARDKLHCLELFSAHGMDLPKSASIESMHKAPDLLAAHFSFPLLIKQHDSTQGHGVERVWNSVQALQRMAELFALDEPFLLQEFIAEAQAADLRLFVLNGEVIAAMKRRAMLGDFRANTHLGGTAEIHKPDAQEIEIAVKATGLLGLDVAGVDIIQSRRGPLLLEVNASPGFEALERVSGLDVAGKMLDLLISRK